uniref:Ubiquitin-like domain-containing protein n=1 Tax=Petromyzon marinus TaxID=7757 RepID=S4RLY9_PETMA
VQIFVVNFQGSTRTYDVSLSDRVQQLKVKIHREEGVPPREQILTFESQQLEGERTLRSYNIRAQSTIQLQARLRGGQSIVVKDLEGNSLRLMVKLSESVLELKARIQSKWKVSPAQQRLAYGGTALQDGTTLAKCGLKQNSTVNLLHVDNAVDVFVKTLANKTLTIEVKLSNSVLSLKQKVHQKAGIAVNQQILTFGSHTLEDDQKLESYGIQQHSTITMQGRLRGGYQVVVKDLEGKSLRLMVKLSETVLELKARIQSKWKVSPAQQRLAYGGTALQDGTTLAKCGLKQNSTVNLLHVDNAVDVFVKTLANKTLTIEVKLSNSVLSLKQKVHQKAGIAVNQQILTFGSHTLEDDQKLESYGIQQHSTITMQGRLRGG